ncbi:MAG: hypothetical protein RLZZ399_1936 [Verrucomicrobiota bacterium]|jgi:hypothetical protein
MRWQTERCEGRGVWEWPRRLFRAWQVWLVCLGGWSAPCCLEATQAVLVQDTYTSSAPGQAGVIFDSGAASLALSIDGRPGAQRRGWLQFDLQSVLPEGTTWAQVAKATLTLYVRSVVVPGKIRVEAAKGAWSERTLTHQNGPGSQNDPSGNPYAAAEVALSSRFVALDVTELVRDWLDGSLPNHGLVVAPGDPSVRLVLDSKESLVGGHAASLEVTLSGGRPGATWLQGSGKPPESLGSLGDFYWDSQSLAFYGPKNEAGWGSASVLRGPAGVPGAAGAPGKTWFGGNTVPTLQLGTLGDFYINVAASRVYGPKTAQGWGGGVSIKGATGATGAKGEPGPMGPIGFTGPVGPVGPQGERGPQGEPGVEGAQGPQGVPGPQGEPGVRGADGRNWLLGDGPATPDWGQDGDLYLDKVSGQVWGPKWSGDWGQPVLTLRGPAGVAGPEGPRGGVGVPSHLEPMGDLSMGIFTATPPQ